MLGSIYYHGIIRKITVAFGSIFKDITIVREETDGSENKRFVVPINFGNKEKFEARLQGDPSLDRKIQISLPRLAFELKGISYDASRKQQTMIQQLNFTNNGVSSEYVPVPYDFQYTLTAYTRNIEDGQQIVEQILPFFTPDFTLNINLIPEMGITRAIPFIFDSIDYMVDSEGGNESDTRVIMWTLNFTAKAFLYGPVKSGNNVKLIKEVITNFYDHIEKDRIVFILDTGVGNYQNGEYVYQGLDPTKRTSSAKVTNWSNSSSKLEVSDITGKFVTNENIIGIDSGAKFPLLNYEVTLLPIETMTVTPNPPSANKGDDYGIIVTKTQG